MIDFFIIITSSCLSFFLIQEVIEISIQKKLFDNPNEIRKIHKHAIPNLGGIAVFISFLLTFLLFFNKDYAHNLNYLLLVYLIIIIIGIKDDIIGINPYTKLLSQSAAAFILINFLDTRIIIFDDLNYIYHIINNLLSFLTIILIINAFNLIDGINGLLASLTLISLLFFLVFFPINKFIILPLFGSLVSFLYYNMKKKNIFMGDTGSLFIGVIISTLFISSLKVQNNFSYYKKIELCLSFFAIPVFDTIRLFILRISKKKSPFSADNNHIHHLFLKLGYSHNKTTLIICFLAIFFILFTILSLILHIKYLYIYQFIILVFFFSSIFYYSNNFKQK